MAQSLLRCGYGPGSAGAAPARGVADSAGRPGRPARGQRRAPPPRRSRHARGTAELVRLSVAGCRADGAPAAHVVPLRSAADRRGDHGRLPVSRIRLSPDIRVAHRGLPDGRPGRVAVAHVSAAGAGLGGRGVADSVDPRRGTTPDGGQHRHRCVAAGARRDRRGHPAAAGGARRAASAQGCDGPRSPLRARATGHAGAAVHRPRAARRARPQPVDDQRAVLGGAGTARQPSGAGGAGARGNQRCQQTSDFGCALAGDGAARRHRSTHRADAGHRRSGRTGRHGARDGVDRDDGRAGFAATAADGDRRRRSPHRAGVADQCGAALDGRKRRSDSDLRRR